MTTLDTIRNENIGTLNELTDISRDSAKFFGEVAYKIEDKAMRQLSGEISESRLRLVNTLDSGVSKSAGAPMASNGDTRTAWRQHYVDVCNRINDKSMAYITDIEVGERRLSKAFDNVVNDKSLPASTKKAVAEYLPMMQKQHHVIHEKALAIKKAA